MTKFLRSRVLESVRVGYHQSTERWPRDRLLGLRARDDKGFGERLKKMYGRDMAASEDDQPSFFFGVDNRKVAKKVSPRINSEQQSKTSSDSRCGNLNCQICYGPGRG